jgi:adenosylcobinamide-GDP ribazoletransferase
VLAIMKDSRIGAFGGIGLGLVVLLKWQSVASAATFNVDGVRRVAAGLWCAHTLSRGVVCLVPTMLPYLDSAGSKSRPLLEPLSGFRMAAAGSFAVVPTLVCGECGIFSAIRLGVGAAVMLAIALGLSGWFSKRLGGYTGDCLGAVQQLTELAFYLVVFATWR